MIESLLPVLVFGLASLSAFSQAFLPLAATGAGGGSAEAQPRSNPNRVCVPELCNLDIKPDPNGRKKRITRLRRFLTCFF